MGILDSSPLPVPPLQAPALSPDLQAMIAQNQQTTPMPQQAAQPPVAQPMPLQAPAPTGPKVLDPMLAQKNPNLVVPGVVVSGHVYKGGDKADEANWQMLTGDDFIKTIPQTEQLAVKQMVAGRMPFPGARAISTPYWQQKLQEAQQYDPKFDASNWDGRVKTVRDYSPGGKVGQALISGSTAINHLGHLNALIDGVSGVSVPLVGSAINHAINAWDAPQGRLNPYNDTNGHLAEETTKFYRGTGGAESDVLRNMENLSPDNSTPAKQSGVANTVSLIYGKLKPAADAYNSQMGTNLPPSHFLSPDAVQTLKKMGFDPDTGERVGKPQSASGPLPSPQKLPRVQAQHPQDIQALLKKYGQ